MSKFKTGAVRVNILVDIDLRKKYKIYCIKNNFMLSERIRKLILLDLNGDIK